MTFRLSKLITFVIASFGFNAFPQGFGQPAQQIYVQPQVQYSQSSQAQPSSVGKVVNIEILQRLLIRLGLFNGQPNGILTDATIEALRTFAYQNRIIFNGQITDELVRALRRVAWETGGWKKGNLKGQEKLIDAKGIKEAQSYLSRLGFDPGPIDGTFGAGTQTAVEAYEASQRISSDGLITKTTLFNLKRSFDNKSLNFVGTVRIVNWPDYIDPSVLDEFEKEFKIRVIYDTYGSNEELEGKLKSSPEPFDVAVPTASNIKSLVATNLLKPLDKKLLKNIGNIDPKISAYVESWDPGAVYSVPYMWFTMGIATNQNLVSKFLPGANYESMGLIFDPAQASRLSGCGVRVVDSASDIVPLAALYGGIKSWNNDSRSMAAAERVLMGVKGLVKPISNDEYIDSLAQGKICAAVGFSGDTIQARFSVSGNNVTNIKYRIPLEGGSLGFDTLTIPANAKNTTYAIQFIDFVLRPRVIAKITNQVHYANANINSGQFIDPSILNDPGIFPSQQSMKNLISVPALTPSIKAEIDKLWEKFSK